MRAIKDLTGEKFGRLVVESLAGRNKWGSVLWNCRCKCNNTKVISSRGLVAGKTKSCGCLMKETTQERQFIEITDREFGRLTAMSISDRKGIKGGSYWWVSCSCPMGTIKEVLTASLISGHTTSCGCLKKENSSRAMKEFHALRRLQKGS